jgi:hypothetical protein
LLPTGVFIDDELYTMYDIQEHLRHLRTEDMDELCKKDVRTLAIDINKARNSGEDSILTILPTTGLIGWQHARAEFLGKKIYNKEPFTVPMPGSTGITTLESNDSSFNGFGYLTS